VELKTTDVGIIVFARMNSSRLPHKAMKKMGSFPLVERVLRRAQLTGHQVVLATSDRSDDTILEITAINAGMHCFRGSEDHVLERAVLASEKFGFKAFARLCGDRPLFSIKEMKFAITAWKNAESAEKPDLITNHYPEKCVRGLTTEIINTQTLRNQLENNPDAKQQEHLTAGFYSHPERYTIKSLKPRYMRWSKHSGFAVDTEQDFKVISQFIDRHPGLDYELEAEEVELTK
jgi:spore coat polysaccharide biosynthesis protein SpsF